MIMITSPLRKLFLLGLSATLGLTVGQAAIVTIGGYNFDLAQFAGAQASTTSTFSDGREFDQATGTDGFTLGELAIGPGPNQFPVDPGDFLTLGNSTLQQWISLSYATPFTVGVGEASRFVVYEVASAVSQTVDGEGLGFEISFDGLAIGDAGKSWVQPSAANALLSTTGVLGGDGVSYNQIAFDLTNAAFGFSAGNTIQKVDFRNKLGLGGNSDPDLIFAAHAGLRTTNAVPSGGNALWMWVGGLAGLAVLRRWMGSARG